MQLLALIGNGTWVHALLLGSAFGAWHGLFAHPAFTAGLIAGCLVSVAWLAASLTGAWSAFARRDFAGVSAGSAFRVWKMSAPVWRSPGGRGARGARGGDQLGSDRRDARASEELVCGDLQRPDTAAAAAARPSGFARGTRKLNQRFLTACARQRSGSSGGPGDDWVCNVDVLIPLNRGRAPLDARTVSYDVSVQSNGCYKADSPPSFVGSQLMRVPHGGTRGQPAVHDLWLLQHALEDLPAGPALAPAAWQTVAWMARPGAFMQRLHRRYGDPVTIRTYWTAEPMVLFSDPDAVREVFRLDPAIAPAGQSWEFLRPFAGPHSILLLDGEEHLRERRLMAAPFHGERMRAFAPMIAELANEELERWSGRVVALERMRELTLEIILRIVFGADEAEATAPARRDREHARRRPFDAADAVDGADPAGSQARGALGGDSGSPSSASTRCCSSCSRDRAAPRHAAEQDSVLAMLLEQRDDDGNPPSDPPAARSARSAARRRT